MYGQIKKTLSLMHSLQRQSLPYSALKYMNGNNLKSSQVLYELSKGLRIINGGQTTARRYLGETTLHKMSCLSPNSLSRSTLFLIMEPLRRKPLIVQMSPAWHTIISGRKRILPPCSAIFSPNFLSEKYVYFSSSPPAPSTASLPVGGIS